MAGTCAALTAFKALMSVMTAYIETQTSSDLHSSDVLTHGDTFDFIIVGGGSAGCVVANRLSEISDWRVLLLEAGGEEPFVTDIPVNYNYNIGSRLDWYSKTQPEPTSCGGEPCIWSAGKVLGGGSSINAMMYNRGNPRDYDHWAKLGNEGWSFEEVLPYFKKSENNLDADIARDTKHHSTGGYQSVGRWPYQDDNVKTIYDAFLELGLPPTDYNGDRATGVMLTQHTQENGERRSTNRAFLEPIRKRRPNLTVATNVRVARVLVHPENNTAYGVEYALEHSRSVRRQVYASKEVIISAGAVHSPQILMLSGIGPKDVLEPLGIPVLSNIAVGQNLHNQVGSNAVKYFMKGVVPPEGQPLIDAIRYMQPKRDGPWASTALLQVSVNFNSKYADPNEDYPDLYFLFMSGLAPNNNTDCQGEKTPLSYYNMVITMPTVLRPRSRGYITINSTDPFAQPLIYPRFYTNQYDKDLIVDGSRMATKLAETKAFKKAGFVLDTTPLKGCTHITYASDEYWECAARIYTGLMYHPVGTCKMGPPSDRSAVVDPQLRVYAIKSLRVADASIMPFTPSGNTNVPSIMIGEKVSDMIKDTVKDVEYVNI